MSARRAIRPAAGALVGISKQGTTQNQGVTDHENLMGFKVDIPHYYNVWNDSQPNSEKIARAEAGQIPLMSWQGRRLDGSVVGWANIASGAEDTIIDAQAARFAAVNGQFLYSFENEPEDLSPANGTHLEYRAACQRIIDRFKAAGADNVHWVFCVMGVMTTNKQNQVLNCWPGERYIDWVAYDPYNWFWERSNPWVSWNDMVNPWYQWATTNLTNDRPYMLSEYGSVIDPDDATRRPLWFKEAADAIEAGTYPLLEALVYFDQPKPPGSGQWSLGTGDDLHAYREMAQRLRAMQRVTRKKKYITIGA